MKPGAMKPDRGTDAYQIRIPWAYVPGIVAMTLYTTAIMTGAFGMPELHMDCAQLRQDLIESGEEHWAEPGERVCGYRNSMAYAGTLGTYLLIAFVFFCIPYMAAHIRWGWGSGV